MSAYHFDWNRHEYAGVPESVFCASKTAAQIAEIIVQTAQRERPLLLTKLSRDRVDELPPEIADSLDFDHVSGTAIHGGNLRRPVKRGVAVVCAGVSDLPVAGEAARTLAFHGIDPLVVSDVGVAGLWRLMERIDELRAQKVIIAVAGMEGALFSVLAGLVPIPVVAVPVSVGYGVSEGGRTALDAALASCVPGLTVVNIDNGYGAAVAAVKIVAAAS
jgi:NCAIR mutase (PurE)-related protein